MISSDRPKFATLIVGLADYYQRPLTETTVELYWNGLKDYDYDAISAAAQAHMANPAKGAFMPKIADFVAVLRGKFESDFPGSDEAWGTVARIMADEAETAVLTEEMSEAWGIAAPIYEIGDEVGARMAFRQAYDRLVEAARLEGRKPKWSITLGTDKRIQEIRLREAVEKKRIPSSALAAITYEPVGISQAIALLENRAKSAASEADQTEKAVANLRALRQRLEKRGESFEQGVARREAERKEEAAKRDAYFDELEKRVQEQKSGKDAA
jgi:hypothetical protein